jgi:hypothetical protein
MRMRICIRDPRIFLTLDPESGMKKIPIRDKHPGFAKLRYSPGKVLIFRVILVQYIV